MPVCGRVSYYPGFTEYFWPSAAPVHSGQTQHSAEQQHHVRNRPLATRPSSPSWPRASAALGRDLAAPKDVFAFGGANAALADELLELAVAGKKTATTSWPVPEPRYWDVGDLSVILDGRGVPAAVMRTVSFVECRFRDVAEDFALAEAEGDYDEYRRGHLAFYGRQADGHLFGDDSIVLCERFEVIYSVAGK